MSLLNPSGHLNETFVGTLASAPVEEITPLLLDGRRVQSNTFVNVPLKTIDLNDLTDEALIKHSQNGDRRAFDVLWKRYAPKVRTIVIRFVRRSADAEQSRI